MNSLMFALIALGMCGSYVANAVSQSELPEKGCGNKPADIAFVLDESGSIWGPDFDRQIQFVKDVVGIFQIGPDKTRIGALTFGTDTHIIFNMDSESTQITGAVSQIRQRRGGTRTYDAIDVMHNDMFSSNHARPGVPHIGIVITDGESEDTDKTANAAKAAREAGITLFAVGVGRNANRKELESIASKPTKDYMFTVDNYAGLKTLRNILAWRACQVTTLPPPTTTATTTTTTTTTTPIPPTTLPQSIDGCTARYPLDVIFALPDEAGTDDTADSLLFIKEVVGEMEMSPFQVQVGVTPRLCSLKKAVHLKANDNVEGFLVSLEERQLSSTRINNQLRYLHQEGFTSKNGARRNSVKFGILIVDNKSTDRAKTLKQAAIAKDDMRLVVIGVGDHVDSSELEQIASDKNDVYYASSFKDLPQLAETVVETMCNTLREEVFKEDFREDEAELERAEWRVQW